MKNINDHKCGTTCRILPKSSFLKVGADSDWVKVDMWCQAKDMWMIVEVDTEVSTTYFLKD